MNFRLEIQQIDRTCLFKLIWHNGQQISTILAYPETLSELYATWRKAYLGFYKTALRARVRKPKNEGGQIDLPQDKHRLLVQAEAQLLAEFQRWLRQSELYEIRAKIASQGKTNFPVHLFLTCSEELIRLPWETWRLGEEFGCQVAIARTPTRMTSSGNKVKQKRKPRILAILGDDTGLDLTGDRNSLAAIAQLAKIEFVTWQPQQPAREIKQQIVDQLTDPQGWEVLFFAGHSNETAMTGGELAIAPNLAISVAEIAPQLKIALANGLQFALFNSCSGLSIANSLIDLGMSQVAIMREPIHNQVAQVFLVRLLQALANYENVQQALNSTVAYLQQEQLAYPSAHLIPSLFCHPDADLFRIQPWGWQQQLKKWLPEGKELAIATSLCLLSILPPVQNFLLDKRTLTQAIYRDLTGQIPATPAPVTLVHIDELSLQKADIQRPVPMDRRYLASLVDRLVAAETKVIGIDYLLDRPQAKNDPILAQSVNNARETNFIFAAIKQPNGAILGVTEETGINLEGIFQGYTTDSSPNYYLSLPLDNDCNSSCPFAYVLDAIESGKKSTVKQHPLTTASQYLSQQWLRPIQDFSLPPNLVYQRLPAWQLLEEDLPNLSQQIVIIGSGGYNEAGLVAGSDNFPTPSAVSYWQPERRLDLNQTPFTGSEFLAYMTHHWMKDRLVIPLPELGAVLAALLVAKGIKLRLSPTEINPRWLLGMLSGGTLFYGIVALQLYITGAILLPWLLPSIAIWIYVISSIKNRSHE